MDELVAQDADDFLSKFFVPLLWCDKPERQYCQPVRSLSGGSFWGCGLRAGGPFRAPRSRRQLPVRHEGGGKRYNQRSQQCHRPFWLSAGGNRRALVARAQARLARRASSEQSKVRKQLLRCRITIFEALLERPIHNLLQLPWRIGANLA